MIHRIIEWVMWTPRRAKIIGYGTVAVLAFGVLTAVRLPSFNAAAPDASPTATSTAAPAMTYVPYTPTPSPVIATPTASPSGSPTVGDPNRAALEFVNDYLRIHDYTRAQWLQSVKRHITGAQVTKEVDAIQSSMVPFAVAVRPVPVKVTAKNATTDVLISTGELWTVELVNQSGKWLVTQYGPKAAGE